MSVFVKMDRQVFESLDDNELGWACMAPIMEPLRGKDPSTKLQVYSELTTSQQVLFMFYAYYNHAKGSLGEHYWWSAYYLAQPKTWSEIIDRLKKYEGEDFVALLEETERVLRARNHPRSLEAFDVSPDDVEKDVLLCEAMRPLYNTFCEITPVTLKKFALYIRRNPDEFVDLQEAKVMK